MIELRLSAHSLDKFACPLRGYMYRFLRRAAAEHGPGLVQGIAGHAAVAAWRRGLSVEAQCKAIDEAFAAGTEIPADDYRTPGYLKDILEQYRAEHAAERWEWLEVERPFEVELGVISWGRVDASCGYCRVIWTGRRDAVGRDLETGDLYVFDEKFMSRDEGADREAAKNSCALKGYCWSYQHETGQRIKGAYLRRTIIRKPTREKPLNFTLPPDPPILFSKDRLDEWKGNVLNRAREIVSRDPQDPVQWPMVETLCRHTFGTCDYLCVCEMSPGVDRERMLASPAFCEPHSN